MKSIVYILLAVFISSILMTSIPANLLAGNQTIRIECVDSISTSKQLTESANIIEQRLKDYGVERYSLKVLKDEKSIIIQLQEKVEQNDIIQLLTSKGKLEFYETFKAEDIKGKLKKNDPIFSLLNIPDEQNELYKLNSNAVLGYTNYENRNKADNYLSTLSISYPELKDVKFLWSISESTTDIFQLFVLHKNPGLTGETVARSHASTDEVNMNSIYITLNNQGKKTWENLTSKNIGNAIAIVLDNRVYSAPRVMDTIHGGECMITGQFSQNQTRLIASLINNPVLPLNLKIVKF